MTAALKQLWAACKFRTRDVVLGVTNPQLVVREMSVSNLPRKEMQQVAAVPGARRAAAAGRALAAGLLPAGGPGRQPDRPRAADRRAEGRRADRRAGGRARRPARGTGRPRLVRPAARRLPARRAGRGDRRHRRPDDQRGRARRRRAADRADRPARRRRDHQSIATRLGTTVPEAEALKCRIGLRGDGGPDTADADPRGRPPAGQRDPQLLHLPRLGRTAEAGHPTRAVRRRLAAAGPRRGTCSTQLDLHVVLADPAIRLRDTRRAGGSAASTVPCPRPRCRSA